MQMLTGQSPSICSHVTLGSSISSIIYTSSERVETINLVFLFSILTPSCEVILVWLRHCFLGASPFFSLMLIFLCWETTMPITSLLFVHSWEKWWVKRFIKLLTDWICPAVICNFQRLYNIFYQLLTRGAGTEGIWIYDALIQVIKRCQRKFDNLAESLFSVSVTSRIILRVVLHSLLLWLNWNHFRLLSIKDQV